MRLKVDRIKYWLGVGAQPSTRVGWLLSKFNITPPPVIPNTTIQHIPRKERAEE